MVKAHQISYGRFLCGRFWYSFLVGADIFLGGRLWWIGERLWWALCEALYEALLVSALYVRFW